MLKRLRFYHFLLIALLMCGPLNASDETGMVGPAHKVDLLTDRVLESFARDLASMKSLRQQYDKFTSIQHHGINILTSLGVNGYGSSIIVWDTKFEQDLYTTLVFPKDHPVADSDYEMNDFLHGTLVAACAASKYPPSHGLAYGATVYTCSTSSLTNESELDRIESAINYCLTTGSPKPRVINMSMKYNLYPSSLKEMTTRLTTILQKHDMLLVTSAGNYGKKINQDRGASDKGLWCFQTQLEDYPELLKHTIFVGATDSKTESQPASYSNLAGDLKDHVIFADGLRLYQAILLSKGLQSKACEDEDFRQQGTSISAPILTSLADILFKYFPHLNSQRVKQIILGSASKEKGHDSNIMGQGVMDPLQAWIAASESPVVSGPYSPGFHFDKTFFQNMNASLGALTILNLSGVKGLYANGRNFVEAVKQMVQLESINVMKADLSNSQTIALAEALEDKKKLWEVSLTMPYHWSNLFENEQKLISDSWECIKRKPIFTWYILERSFGPIVLGWPLDLLADAVLLQGQEYESTCKSLAKIENLRRVKLYIRNWIKFKEWTSQQINDMRKKIDNKLSDVQVDFDE